VHFLPPNVILAKYPGRMYPMKTMIAYAGVGDARLHPTRQIDYFDPKDGFRREGKMTLGSGGAFHINVLSKGLNYKFDDRKKGS
jgi:hypothetical protein